MRIFITGASGLIGSRLIDFLVEKNHDVFAIGRNAPSNISESNFIYTDYQDFSEMQPYLNDKYAIINLAGENVGSKKWSQKQKDKIYDSRVNLGKNLSKFILKQENPPVVFLQGSAIGFYENEKDVLCDEYSIGTTKFLSKVVQDAELSVIALKEKCRIVFLRTGVVLSKYGGALPKMALPYKLFIGGKTGSGKQNMSWIHIEDEIRAIEFLVTNKVAKGIYNLVSPFPVTNKTFSKTLGKNLNRPSFFTVPSKIIKLLFGEMGEEVVLKGQKVIPKRLQDLGFEFKYPHLEDALENIFQKK
jgi:uncharacterized protein (TIGR01777 family)